MSSREAIQAESGRCGTTVSATDRRHLKSLLLGLPLHFLISELLWIADRMTQTTKIAAGSNYAA